MADMTGRDYDASIGTNERSVVAATKLWGIILVLIAVFGLIVLIVFLTRTNSTSTGPVSSDNTATRPAEP